MPLKPVAELMADARAGGYALGYFESWNLESLQGVLDAAERTRSPILIGFNGQFLSGPRRLAEERLSVYAAMGAAAAASASVPCGLLFNECSRDDWLRRAVALGFNMVAIADDQAEPAELQRRTAELTEYAHEHGAAVEAEVDELPYGAPADADGPAAMTDPARAADFVEATGLDVLAVSTGNVHVLVRGRCDLDIRHLERIREKVSIPLALHGGTGISDESLRQAIALGVTKVNYGTYLKQRYLEAVHSASSESDVDPHALLGLGGAEDVMVAGRLAVRDAVLERIESLGCCGHA